MLQFISAGVLLLTIALSVSAGERYVEIWNPPEARIGAAGGKPARKTRSPVSRHNAAKLTPRRVADPLTRSAPAKRAPAAVGKKPSVPPYIPRVITPEGNVLRV